MQREYDLNEIEWPDTPFPLKEHLILAARRGSEAHGTYIPPTDPNGIDDKDVMGIIIQNPNGYIGMRSWDHAESIKGVWDVVLYDIRKTVKMLCGQNPNVISLLWVRPEDYIYMTSIGSILVQSRELFIAKEPFYKSFIGYAYGQFKRMVNHEGDPKRGFMGEKRKKLVEKYGYDCKNAAHMIRLLHMGNEFLETGKLNVYRTWDADIIKDIKTGGWSLDAVTDYSNRLFEKAEELFKISKIQEVVDMERVEELLVTMIEQHWKEEY